MRIENLTKAINLPHTSNLTAIIAIERIGQNPPSIDNKVSVRATLSLPGDRENSLLLNQITFGCRLTIMGGQLSRHWGNAREGDRLIGRNFSAATYAEAFRAAEEFLVSELQKLTDALEARHQALVDAEQ
jgi:hypothetical protein